MTIGSTTVSFQIVDLAFDVEATASDFHQSKACIAVVDYTNVESFANVKNFQATATRYSDDNFKFYVVANKSDLEHTVTQEKIDEMSADFKFMSVSAKTGEGIEDLFKTIAVDAGAVQEKKGGKKGGKKEGKKCLIL